MILLLREFGIIGIMSKLLLADSLDLGIEFAGHSQKSNRSNRGIQVYIYIYIYIYTYIYIYIYRRKLENTYFCHSMVYGNAKDLPRKGASIKALCDKVFKIYSNPKYN